MRISGIPGLGVLEIKTFGLGPKIRDVEVGGLKNHNLMLENL